MEGSLSRDEQKELMSLLGLHGSYWGAFSVMRKAYLEKCKEYHPDKGGDENKMKRMNELYKVVVDALRESSQPCSSWSSSEIPTYGTSQWEHWWETFNQHWEDDLSCKEDMPPESPVSQDKPDSPHSRSRSPPLSQATPPKKPRMSEHPKEFPEELRSFLSQAIFSNKTMSAFALYTTKEKGPLLYGKLVDKYHVNFASRHGHGIYNVIFMITPTKHRVTAVSNYCSRFCTVSFILCRGVLKEYHLYAALCLDPFTLEEESILGGLKEDFFTEMEKEEGKQVNWMMVSEFAKGIRSEDVHLIMGYYNEFAYLPCLKCNSQSDPIHVKYHEAHHKNAKLFKEAHNQKNICQQAVDSVIAVRRVIASTSTREDLLADRFLLLFEKLRNVYSEERILLHMAGVAWFSVLFKNLEALLVGYLEMVVRNVPKQRYWLFKGPINSGKTTLAAALLDLCGGKALNINLPFDRINFELGVAIDEFTVVFEDVKGQPEENKNLTSGQGIANLDNLRDYIDGSVKVNLEKKHMNKRSQIFPPGLVTMNEYKVPETLLIRFSKVILFHRRKCLRDSLFRTPELGQNRILQSGLTLLMALLWYCPMDKFHEKVQEQVAHWKEVIDKNISITRFGQMLENVANGVDILDTTERAKANADITEEFYRTVFDDNAETLSVNPDTGDTTPELKCEN
ncbi:large T antigen [Betapolyomavirus callosciuri]|uniref:Large T antigen n=1 Tax=Betapolyomavirus callosciuri TaxID=2721749 RepID=A0A6G9LX01_9POLY|nr:large T antigen [Betapolyomavirus callosciuri]QIQ69380.1 large T antigen [Betapolyomavirus callosciuri]